MDPEGWKILGDQKKIHLDDIRKLKDDKQTYYKERWIKENGLEQKLIVTYTRLSAIPGIYPRKASGESNEKSRESKYIK